MQRHVEHYDIEAEVCGRDTPVISFHTDALSGKNALRVEGRFERSALEYVGEESDGEPEHDCSPYDDSTLLESGSAEYSTI